MSLRNTAFAILILVIAAVCVRLGFWQLDRLHQRRTANAVALSIRAQPVVDLGMPHDPVATGREVRAAGRFLAEATVVLRGRAHRGAPGIVLATPLAVDGSDSVVMVLRGFIPAPDAATADPAAYPPPDTVSVRGIAVELSGAGGSEPITVAGQETWRRLDLHALRSRLGSRVHPFALQPLPDTAGSTLPTPLPLPPLDDGPHLSYAVQWFAFATIALVGGGIWLRHGNRNS